MNTDMVDLQREWRDLADQTDEARTGRTRDLMGKIASAEVDDQQAAAFKLEVAVNYLDDGERREAAVLPEDRAVLAIIISVLRYLTSWAK